MSGYICIHQSNQQINQFYHVVCWWLLMSHVCDHVIYFRLLLFVGRWANCEKFLLFIFFVFFRFIIIVVCISSKIESDTEINISYGIYANDYNFNERQQYLWKRYRFHCQCNACLKQQQQEQEKKNPPLQFSPPCSC